MADKALRHNDEKVPIDKVLLFDRGLDFLTYVMTQGEIKYPDVSETGLPNWLLGGKENEEYTGAMARHLRKIKKGEVYDEELGTHHVAHIAWNALAYLTLNCDDLELLNPAHDQEAFVAKWAKFYEDKRRAEEERTAEVPSAWDVVGGTYD